MTLNGVMALILRCHQFGSFWWNRLRQSGWR